MKRWKVVASRTFDKWQGGTTQPGASPAQPLPILFSNSDARANLFRISGYAMMSPDASWTNENGGSSVTFSACFADEYGNTFSPGPSVGAGASDAVSPSDSYGGLDGKVFNVAANSDITYYIYTVGGADGEGGVRPFSSDCWFTINIALEQLVDE